MDVLMSRVVVVEDIIVFRWRTRTGTMRQAMRLAGSASDLRVERAVAARGGWLRMGPDKWVLRR